MRLILLTLCLGLPLVCAADATLYKWVDAEGTVHFSDQPQAGAEKITVHDIQTVPAVKSQPSSGEQKKNDEIAYSVTITSPASEETVRENSGAVNVNVSVEPPLRADLGHRLQFTLDGARQGEPGSSTSLSLANLDRGSHTVQATVTDEQGKALASSSLTFFLQRVSVQQNPNTPPPAKPQP